MTEKRVQINSPAQLRKMAEVQFSKLIENSDAVLSNLEMQKLIKEMRLQQFESKIQIDSYQQEISNLEIEFQKYFELYKLSPFCYFMVNEYGLILEGNLATNFLTGFDIGQIYLKPFSFLIHPSDHEKYQVFFETFLKEKNRSEIHLRILKNDCSEKWVQLIPLVINNTLCGTVYYFALNDITLLKKAEYRNEVEESEKDVIINSTDDVIWSITKELKLITCNRAFRDSAKAFSGAIFKPGDEVLLRNHYPKEMIDFWENLYLRGLAGEIIKMEYYVPATSNSLESWLELNINPIYWEDEVTSLACFGRVITKRKHDELKLFNSAKMASLGEMAGGIAHEINNPLSIILGYTSKIIRQLRKPTPETDSLISDIEKIMETTKRISKIINGLKTFSRSAENDIFLNISVKSVIEESLGLCQEKFKVNGVEILIDDNSNLFFECRATQISQILLNLFNNAFDAIISLPIKWIRVEVIVLENDRFQIAITDSGSGISPENVNKIMQPFFTTKEVGKGTGLGLSISLGIAQDHGGVLKVDSASKHTRFILELPIKQNKS